MGILEEGIVTVDWVSSEAIGDTEGPLQAAGLLQYFWPQ